MNNRIRKPMRTVLLCFSILLISLQIQAQEESVCLKRSEIILRALQSDQMDSLNIFANKQLLAALPPQSLKGTWGQLEAASGTFIEAGPFQVTPYDTFLLVTSPLRFEDKSYQLRMSYDQENRLQGIFFSPIRTAPTYKLEFNEWFTEKEIKVPSVVDLPGILTLPKGVKSAPVAILVHGSGPQDRDATYGPNKIFRDIAHALAKKGIASIRYDKRTYVGKGFNSSTITSREATVDDALAAVLFAQKTKGLDATRIFIVGHSIGAHLAPRILEQNTDIKGAVMIAGSARPSYELIQKQVRYLYARDGLNAEEEAELEYLKESCKNASKAHKKGKSYTTRELPLGATQSFYAYLNRYNAPKTAKKLDQALLILQGERDYQVSMEDFAIWKKKLKRKKNVNFISYPGLNHFMMHGEGPSYPEEYKVKSNVSAKFASDIAEWILKQE